MNTAEITTTATSTTTTIVNQVYGSIPVEVINAGAGICSSPNCEYLPVEKSFPFLVFTIPFILVIIIYIVGRRLTNETIFNS